MATVTVLVSVFAHGISAPGLTNRYVRCFEANASDLQLESDEVDVHVRRRHRPGRTNEPGPSDVVPD